MYEHDRLTPDRSTIANVIVSEIFQSSALNEFAKPSQKLFLWSAVCRKFSEGLQCNVYTNIRAQLHYMRRRSIKESMPLSWDYHHNMGNKKI